MLLGCVRERIMFVREREIVKVVIGVRLFHIITLLTLVVFVPHIIDITFIVKLFL